MKRPVTTQKEADRRKALALRNRESAKHGMSYSPTHRAWRAMRQRCTNSKTSRFDRYGGRGIAVCERWLDFENFLADMGERPDGTSLDRFPNNDGDYEPGNCRWATAFEQMSNCRRNKYLEFSGKRMTVSQWARELGMSRQVFGQRLLTGWTLEDAITTPRLKRGPPPRHIP